MTDKIGGKLWNEYLRHTVEKEDRRLSCFDTKKLNSFGIRKPAGSYMICRETDESTRNITQRSGSQENIELIEINFFVTEENTVLEIESRSSFNVINGNEENINRKVRR